MKKTPMSTYEFHKLYPDEQTARTYIEGRRWPGGPICPTCQETKRIGTRKGGFYRCNACGVDFTVRTNTIFERSHVPLHKWLYAMYLLMTSRKGIASLQLAKELGITQKTAWFVLHRIREACGNDMTALRGIVEVDETYIGGKEKAKHANMRLHAGRGPVGKTPVIGMRERGGRAKAAPVESVDAANLRKIICDNVAAGSTLHTDENPTYEGMKGLLYQHESVNHSAHQYVRNGVTTNSVESMWALLKRGLHGVYHHASKKHLGRYVNEFTFCLNDGNVRRQRVERLASLVSAAFGHHITYKQLTKTV